LICIEGGSAGKKLAYLDKDVCFVNKLACIESLKNQDAKYINYFTHSSLFKYSFELATTGLIPGVSMSELKDIISLCPPLQEQQTIANYLDIATAKIDTLIEKQTKLIELLREKRQAVISTAVTRGLDNTVAMKDSGVEWLGEIPEHWEVLQLKRISSIKGGYAYSTSDFEDEGVQIIKIGNVYQSKFHTDRQPTFISLDVAKKTREFLIAEGDLIISLTGTLGKRDYGYAVTVDQKGEYRLNQRVAKMIPNNKLVATKYLSYIMKSEQYLTQIYALPAGTKQANLSNDDVLSAVCALSSLEEQKTIIRYIDDKTSRIDNLITKATKAIDLLKEKRTALISAVVTGKIDVREVA
jgi:type I restriction enzyme S subunit